jgi:hypothetical protein
MESYTGDLVKEGPNNIPYHTIPCGQCVVLADVNNLDSSIHGYVFAVLYY